MCTSRKCILIRTDVVIKKGNALILYTIQLRTAMFSLPPSLHFHPPCACSWGRSKSKRPLVPDQFFFFLYRHDFDWKLYKLENKEMSLSSAPNLCVQHNMLYGTLNNPEAQKYVSFSVPEKAYNEAGLLLNNLLRVRYYDLYYLTLNIGYFYHIIPYPIFDGRQNGRLVYGAGFDL